MRTVISTIGLLLIFTYPVYLNSLQAIRFVRKYLFENADIQIHPFILLGLVILFFIAKKNNSDSKFENIIQVIFVTLSILFILLIEGFLWLASGFNLRF